jgi:nicotinamide-nucleotide amidase
MSVAPVDRRDVAVLAIGDELLAGKHADLNMPLVANRLAEHGRRLVESRVVLDEIDEIVAAVREVAQRCPLIIVTGGLGPTPDDLTRHALAAAANVDVVHDEEAWGQVRAWYERSNRPMPQSNRRQALVPEGAVVLANPAGTAPGFRVAVGDATVIALPGPPREAAATWDTSVVPWLLQHPVDGKRASAFLFFEGLSESVFATEAAEWLDRSQNPQAGVTVSEGVLALRLVAEHADADHAQALLSARIDDFRGRFAEHLFSEQYLDPAEALGVWLIDQDISVSLAESCTGGLVVAALTGVCGISAVLRESFVTYHEDAKVERLGVERALIQEHTVYSEPVVRAMAEGVTAISGARLGIAISGVAGPTSDSPEHPVGQIWFGFCLDGKVTAHERRWAPGAHRNRIRRWATQHALASALRLVRG